MDLILLEKIKGLGDIGDTVKVKPGYGRNYLLPGSRALVATPANREVFEKRKADLLKKSAESLNAAKARAAKIEGLTLLVRVLASEEGRLYGSVGPGEIVRALELAGVEAQRSEIEQADGPIRQIGTYPARVLLHGELAADITIVVEAEKG